MFHSDVLFLANFQCILEQKGLKSAKNALKRYILGTLKITPIYKPFLGKNRWGPYKNQFQKIGSKSVSCRAPCMIKITFIWKLAIEGSKLSHSKTYFMDSRMLSNICFTFFTLSLMSSRI